MNDGAEIFFLDTNVLLYTRDKRDRSKQQRAVAWTTGTWDTGAGRVSWQVLHEYYWNGTRKLKIDPMIVRADVHDLAQFNPVQASLALVQRAWHWCDQAQLAYWDALIVAAAEHCGATYLLSEDFEPKRRFGDCTVLDPFRSDPADYIRPIPPA
ncbi:MAG: PIN domain-containing protein [Terriglobales bacterium]